LFTGVVYETYESEREKIGILNFNKFKEGLGDISRE
jgi:hypothetical protein